MSKESVFAVLALAALYFCYVLFSGNLYKHPSTNHSKGLSPTNDKITPSSQNHPRKESNKQFLGFTNPSLPPDQADETATVNPIALVDQDVQSILADSQKIFVSNNDTAQAVVVTETNVKNTSLSITKPKTESNLTLEFNVSSISNILEQFCEELVQKVQTANDTFANYSLQRVNQTLFEDIIRYSTEREPSKSDIFRVMARNINPFRELQLYNDLLMPKELGKKNDVIGIARDPLYCDLVDTTNIHSTENWRKKRYYYTDYSYGSFLDTFNKYLDEENPIFTTKEFKTLLKKKAYKTLTFPLSEYTTLFYHKRADFKYIGELGLNHLCFTQAYGNIAGLDSLTSKSHLLRLSKEYAERYKGRPECYKREQFIPVAYFLSESNDCKAFFQLINSSEFKKSKKMNNTIQFTVTVETDKDEDFHYLMTDESEASLLKEYDNGNLCGINQNVSIAQMEIYKPLLLEDTKSFDFRVYMLIASTNPLIVFYHDGFVRIANSSSASNDSTEAIEDNLETLQLMTMEAFQAALFNSGQITDENWLNNTLRPQFKTAIAHLIRMGEVNMAKRTGTFRLVGLELKMDKNHKVWLTQVDIDPYFYNSNDEIWKRNEKMIKYMFDIIYTLLKSRIKKLSTLMKDFTADYLIPKKSYDLITMQSLFYSKNADSFDTRFLYGADNTWQPVIDMTKQPDKAYHDLITSACLE